MFTSLCLAGFMICQSKQAGFGNRLGAIAHTQFAKEIMDVEFHRSHRKNQLVGDLPVG